MRADLTKIRSRLSRWLFLGGVALLGFSAVAIAALWVKAATNDMLPTQIADSGNHGPWRFTELRDYVWLVMLLPLYAGCASLLSLVLKPSEKGAWLLGVCAVAFLIVAYYHFPLVD